MNEKVSAETQNEALKVAKGIQKKGQSKEQTKLIAQGIEKGISEYKKLQKAKARERDKNRKKELKIKQSEQEQLESPAENNKLQARELSAWSLLVLSWFGFLAYLFFT